MQARGRMLLLGLVLVLGGPGRARAESVWINAAAPAYSSIQDAVDNATSGDVLCVSTGVFYESVIVSGKTLTLDGGYSEVNTSKIAGARTTLDATNALRALTWLSSTGQVRSFRLVNATNWSTTGGGCYIDKAYFILDDTEVCSNGALWGGGIGIDVGSTVVLMNGAQVYDNAASGGGGIFVGGALTIVDSNCDIFDNQAVNWGGGILVYQGQLTADGAGVYQNRVTGPAGQGGGIMLWSATATASLNDITLSYNQAQEGGGLYSTNTDWEMDTPMIAYNEAAGSGGGVYAVAGRFTLEDPWVIYNEAGQNGGGLCAASGSGLEIRCSQAFDSTTTRVNLSGNECGVNGGAISASDTPLSIEGVHLLGNTAGGDGGAVALEGGRLTVGHAHFVTNACATNGGALVCSDAASVRLSPEAWPWYSATKGWPLLFLGNTSSVAGAAYFVNCATVLVQRAAFITNSSESIGTLYVFGSRCDLDASLFAENSDINGTPGNVSLWSCTGNVHECTFMNNRPIGLSFRQAQMQTRNSILWGSTTAEITNWTGVTTADYCCIESSQVAGNGNITNNPLLYVNYHLRSGSPCINATPDYSGYFDIDYEERGAFDSDDIGCDEFRDTDGDTWPDIVESGTGVWGGEENTGTDPGEADTDDDGQSDSDEWNGASTDPNNPDSVLKFTRLAGPPGDMWTFFWKGGTQAWQVLEWTTHVTGTAWNSFFTNTPPTSVSNAMGIVPQNSPFHVRIRAYR